MSALYVCLTCLPYMSGVHVCLICLPYMSLCNGLCVDEVSLFLSVFFFLSVGERGVSVLQERRICLTSRCALVCL